MPPRGRFFSPQAILQSKNNGDTKIIHQKKDTFEVGWAFTTTCLSEFEFLQSRSINQTPINKNCAVQMEPDK